ncbi:hypothetical protein MJH12_07680 [bacterium]|nr:hypothetical protein [bacterium]
MLNLILFFAFILSCESKEEQTSLLPKPDWVEILNDFRQKGFLKYEQLIMSEIHKLPTSEYRLLDLYDIGSLRKKGQLRLIKEWISISPDSSIAHTVKAIFHSNTAWAKRGYKYSHEVEENGFELMKVFYEKSLKEANIAISLDSSNLFAHLEVLKYSYHYSSKNDYLEYYSKLIKQFPKIKLIRNVRMKFLWPRWSGSIVQMESELRDIRKDLDKLNIKHHYSNYMDYYYAWITRADKEYKRCIQYSLKAGDNGLYADCNYSTKNYKAAVKGYENILKESFLRDCDLPYYIYSIQMTKDNRDIIKHLEFGMNFYTKNSYYWTTAYFENNRIDKPVAACKVAKKSLPIFSDHPSLVYRGLYCLILDKSYETCVDVAESAIINIEFNGFDNKYQNDLDGIKGYAKYCKKLVDYNK